MFMMKSDLGGLIYVVIFKALNNISPYVFIVQQHYSAAKNIAIINLVPFRGVARRVLGVNDPLIRISVDLLYWYFGPYSRKKIVVQAHFG